METEEISITIKEFFLEEFPNEGIDLEYETDLLNDWFVDSLGIINTVIFLEKKFSIAVSRADINAENFENINTLSTFIKNSLT